MAEWDPRPGAAKAVKKARRELTSATYEKKRVQARYRNAKDGYAATLREAVEVLTENTDMTTREIAQLLGLRSPSTVSDVRHGRR